MGYTSSRTRLLLALATMTLLWPVEAPAQERAGVVTMLQGVVAVAHGSAAEPAPLRFKDDVFVRDRITTGERSFVRVLLGSKAVVTAREHSVLTVTEVPGTATIHLASGWIAVAVSKEKMKPGEVVEIATPHITAGIRGTIVVAEVSADRSEITVLRGLIDVTRIDPATGHTAGQPAFLAVRQSIVVHGGSLLPLPEPTTISLEKAKALSDHFTVIPKTLPAASMAAAAAESKARADEDLAAIHPAPALARSGSTGIGNNSGDGLSNGGKHVDSRILGGHMLGVGAGAPKRGRDRP